MRFTSLPPQLRSLVDPSFFGTDLTTISLHNVACDFRGHPFSFPQLISLSLTDCKFDRKKAIISDLPKLRHLAFFVHEFRPTPPELSFLLRYAPTLISLTSSMDMVAFLPRSVLDSTSLSILSRRDFLGNRRTDLLPDVKNLCIAIPNEKDKVSGKDGWRAGGEFEDYARLLLTSAVPVETVTWSVKAGGQGIPHQDESICNGISALNKACYKRGVKVFWVEEDECRTFHTLVPRWFVERSESKGSKAVGGRRSK